MAHFAQLDLDNNVLQVIVVNNSDTKDANGIESETIGITFCKILFGPDTLWVQTSYNGSIRKNYAGIGYKYDAGLDAFIPQKPYPSWILDEQLCQYKAPVAMPTDGKTYSWDEPTQSWVEVINKGGI